MDTSCAYTIGNVSGATMSCYNRPGYSFDYASGGGAGTVAYTFTIGQNDPVLANWGATVYIDFDDPNQNVNNVFYGTVYVIRAGSQISSTPIFSLHGGDASVGCDRPNVGFSAQAGDTISGGVHRRHHNSNTTMRVSGVDVDTHT